jgi:acetyl-CoA C-acetyltransferase
MSSTFILTAKRSAIASFQGSLSSLSAPEIASQVIAKLISSTPQLSPQEIQEVYMGCVLTAGQGQAPARQAALKASLSENTPCTTIGKVCGSGLKSVMLADLSIRSKESELILAGGMESMSQCPYLIPKARQGLRLGSSPLIDSLIHDGLWDVYNQFHMGKAAEICAKEHKITREDQDKYAILSYQRAQKSQPQFKNEIVDITIPNKKLPITFNNDEEVSKVDFEKIPTLKTVFDPNGSVTAANSSSLSDGAAALILASESKTKTLGIKPLARIVAQSQAAQDPAWFSTAPAKSIETLLKKASLKVSDIDFWEINEAFAAVAIANQRLLGIDPNKLNVRGGAVALGHPIGASGARILVTLLHTLKDEKKRYGVASLCIGGGEAVSVLIENLYV